MFEKIGKIIRRMTEVRQMTEERHDGRSASTSTMVYTMRVHPGAR